MGKDKYYKEITICKPIDDRTMARYRCFEILPDGKFFVQAKEHIYEDSDKTYKENLDGYFFGSLSKENFEEMAKDACSTIEEAIIKHENDFKEVEEEFQQYKADSSN